MLYKVRICKYAPLLPDPKMITSCSRCRRTSSALPNQQNTSFPKSLGGHFFKINHIMKIQDILEAQLREAVKKVILFLTRPLRVGGGVEKGWAIRKKKLFLEPFFSSVPKFQWQLRSRGGRGVRPLREELFAASLNNCSLCLSIRKYVCFQMLNSK